MILLSDKDEGRSSLIVGLDKIERQTSRPASGGLGHAGARQGRRSHRAAHHPERADYLLRSAHRQGAVAHHGRREKYPHAAGRRGCGDISNSKRIAWTYAKSTACVVRQSCNQGLVYLLTDSGVITCVDAKTGEVKHEGGRVPAPDVIHGFTDRRRREPSC